MNQPPGGSPDQSGGLLSPGKLRGLEATSTTGHVFSILAIDHLGALSAAIRPENPGGVYNSELAAIKVQLVAWLAGAASGILIDPVVGLNPVVAAGVLPDDRGLMLGIEDGDYASLDKAPRLFTDWDVARAKQAGADAVKCSFFYDPYVPSPAAHEFVAGLVADCARHDLPLFAEPLAPHPMSGDRRRVVVETARRIGALGVDVLKLEYPVAAEESNEDEWLEACLEVTAASPCPWTVLSAGTDFETFVRQFTVACTAGASGFVAGRTIWGNLVAGGLDEKRREEAARRLSVLTEIAVDHALPWTVWANQPDESVVEAGEAKSE